MNGRQTGVAALALAAFVFLLQLPKFLSSPKAMLDLVEMGYVCAWLMLVTTLTRTISVSTLLAFWLVGVYAVFTATLVVGQLIIPLTGNTIAFSTIVASITEETIKAAPVAGFLFLVVRRNGWQTSASDGLLLGYAVGAGFAFHEDAIKRVTSGSGWTATSWSALFPTLLYQSGRPTLGHDGWTALVGLALGLTTLLRHRPRARLIALAALAIVIADHGTANWIGRQGRHLPALVGGANVLLLNGHLAILLLATGIMTAILMDLRALRWAAVRDRWFPPLRMSDLVQLIRRPITLEKLRVLGIALDYIRHRRAAHFGAWRWRHRTAVRDPMENMVTALQTLAPQPNR